MAIIRMPAASNTNEKKALLAAIDKLRIEIAKRSVLVDGLSIRIDSDIVSVPSFGGIYKKATGRKTVSISVELRPRSGKVSG